MLVHFFRRSPYGGFSMDAHEVTLEDIQHEQFDCDVGSESSQYAVIMTSCSISRTCWDAIFYTNSLDEATEQAEKWLNPSSHPIRKDNASDWATKHHYFASLIDIKNNQELRFGDCWQAVETGEIDNEIWHKF